MDNRHDEQMAKFKREINKSCRAQLEANLETEKEIGDEVRRRV